MGYNNMTMVPTNLTEDEILDKGEFLGFDEEPAIVHSGVAYHGAIYEYNGKEYIIRPRPSDKWRDKCNAYSKVFMPWVRRLSDDDYIAYEEGIIHAPLEIEQIKPTEDDWGIEIDVYEITEYTFMSEDLKRTLINELGTCRTVLKGE